MEDEVFFSKSIHLNRLTRSFDLESEENAHILENLFLSIEGSILGVKLSVIKKYFSEEGVRSVRYGLKPIPKSFEIKNEDDFYRMLATLAPLE